MANVEGLQKTLEFIKEHTGEWDQSRWHMCFAGNALRVLKGAVLEDSDCCDACRRLVVDGKELSMAQIGDMAQNFLGLTDAQDTELFRSGNDLEDLTRLVAEFTAEEAVPA